jgi:Predicted inhibitor of MCP methylation, homolog of CheC
MSEMNLSVLEEKEVLMKHRKNILIVDNNPELEQQIRGPLLKLMESSDMSPIVVRAKDGAEAAIKSENQKFDVVLIDTEVPRLMDGGFIYGIASYKNTQDADVMVVSQKDHQELPETLQNAKIFKKPVKPEDITTAMVEMLNAQYSQGDEKKAAPTAATTANTAKYAVDVRVINAIIKATLHVFSQFGVANVKMDKAAPEPAAKPLMGEISSLVDITSASFHGVLAISFDKASYLEVCSSMLMEEQTELNADNQDAVGEINNIIFGNAKAEITNFGVKLTVPKVVMGADQVIPASAGAAGMLIPFSTAKGKFYIKVIAQPAKAA